MQGRGPSQGVGIRGKTKVMKVISDTVGTVHIADDKERIRLLEEKISSFCGSSKRGNGADKFLGRKDREGTICTILIVSLWPPLLPSHCIGQSACPLCSGFLVGTLEPAKALPPVRNEPSRERRSEDTEWVAVVWNAAVIYTLLRARVKKQWFQGMQGEKETQ